jgi:hypothetical protein
MGGSDTVSGPFKQPWASCGRLRTESWSQHGVEDGVELESSYFEFVPFFLFSRYPFYLAFNSKCVYWYC